MKIQKRQAGTLALTLLLCGCAPRQPTFRLAGVLEADEISPAAEPHQNIDEVTVGRTGDVYVAVDRGCGQEDPVSQKALWRDLFPEDSHISTLLLNDGTLFVRAWSSRLPGGERRPDKCWLVALDAQTGKTRWGIETRDHVEGLALANGIVYAQVSTTEFAGFAAEDGRKVWSANLPSKEESGCDHVKILGIEKGVLVCGNDYKDVVIGKHVVIGIDLTSKKVRWRTQVDARDMRYDKGRLYTVTVSNVVCRAMATGTPIWERKVGYQWKDHLQLSVHGECVFVICKPDIQCFSTAGEHRWTWRNRAIMPKEIYPMPKGRLLVVESRRVYVLEPGDMRDELPKQPDARAKVIRDLIARVEKLTWREELLLERVGTEAVPELIRLYGRLLDKRRELSEEEETQRWVCAERIKSYGEARHGGLLEEVLLSQKESAAFELKVLKEIGADDAAVRVLMGWLKKAPDGSEERQSLTDMGESYLVADCKEASAYLAEVLETREPREFLHVAYANGARAGTALQVEQVLALRREPPPPLKEPLPEWLVKALEIKDAHDRNPLAPPRDDLTEEERVLQAAFDARYRFTQDAADLCVVSMPKGWRTLAFTGRDGYTLCFAGKVPPEIDVRLEGQRIAWVSFSFGMDEPPPIEWNADHTEATVSIYTYYGRLSETGYAVKVRKVGTEWVPVLCVMFLIS